MIKTKTRAPLNDLDVGPFSDVSFLLIIFFILTTQIVSMYGKVLSIPAGSPNSEIQETDDDKQITVSLTNDTVTLRLPSGSEFMIESGNVQELKSYLLAEELKDPTKDVSARLVVLQSATDVKYDLYYKVITLIESSGGLLALVEEDDIPGASAEQQEAK